jgi:hypothetical protein
MASPPLALRVESTRLFLTVLTNENHPNTRSQIINRNIYDNYYAMKPGSPFFIRAAELLGQMDIDGRKVWIGLSLK